MTVAKALFRIASRMPAGNPPPAQPVAGRAMVAACLLAFGLSALSGLGWSPAAQAGDLLGIHRLATDHDSQLAAARASWQATQERRPQARALLLPSLTLSASANRYETDTSLSGATNPFLQPGRRQFDTGGLTLQVVQPIYRPANTVLVEQADIQLDQADVQLLLAQQDLTLRVAQAYFDVLGAQEVLTVLEAQQAAIGEQLAQAKANFEIGSATIVDFNEARARADLAGAQAIVARSDLEVRRQSLQQIIGRYPPPLRTLIDSPPMARPDPDDMEQWAARASSQALQVRLQQMGFDLASREIERQRAAHLPTLDAIGSAGHNHAGASATSPVGTDITQYVLGLQLNVPLYQGGGIRSRVREAVASRERALQDIETARRAAALAARQAWLGVASGIGQVRALETALDSSRISLESTELGLKVGVRTQVDVLNAQQTLFAARRDLALARHAVLLAGLRLQAAVGDLQADDLIPINALLR